MKRAGFGTILLVILLSACSPNATPLTVPQPTHTATAVPPTVVPSATALPQPSPVSSAVPDMLYVDPGQSLGPISPLVYGSNYGPWILVSFDMLQSAYDSGVTILRFPAGAWGDHNNVTPLQIDQFIDFTHKMGATALFNVRLLDGTPEQAAQMVRYTNIDRGYGVRYWAIGNEPTLFNSEVQNRGETYDSERFNKEWRAFAEAMKAVDPTIQLVGPEINQFSYDTSPGATTNFSDWDESWMVDFLQANGDLVDVVSFHRYPFPKSSVAGPPSADELRQNAREWDQIIWHARDLIHTHTGRDLPIAITEFNSAYDKSVGREATPDSHLNALWLGDVLGRMIKNGVTIANQWMLTSKGGQGGWGLIGGFDLYPSYHVYQLYKKFGTELVYASSGITDLSIYASKQSDDTLTVIVINLTEQEQITPLQIEGQPESQAETWLFDESHTAESIGSTTINDTITVPPESMTLYIFQK